MRSQMSNVMPIWAGFVSGEKARAVVRRVTDESALLPPTPGDYRLKPDFQYQTGGIVPFGTPAVATFMPVAMFELGMDSEAIEYIRSKWTGIHPNGTFMEHFVEDNNTSMCHAWSAGPVMLLPRYVLGIRPVSPGWEEVEVTPHPGGLEWAEGSVLTPLGEVKIAWEKRDGKVKLNVDAPEKMRVRERVEC